MFLKLGDKIELLILKAKKTLRQPPDDLPKPVAKDDSPCSLDKLEAERSWENVPVTLYVSDVSAPSGKVLWQRQICFPCDLIINGGML